MILVVYGHPYPRHSRGCAALLASLDDVPGIAVRTLHELYPDFDIDVAAEQAALERARALVWLHPLYWYGVPAMLKHWMDKVLLPGFAFGEDGQALAGKPCLWVTTTGRGEYVPGGLHGYGFEAFAAPIERTARYCGMRWLEPFVVHDVAKLSDDELRARGAALRSQLAELAQTRDATDEGA